MPTPPASFAPPLNPERLSAADAAASLPQEGIELFLQNVGNELLPDAPVMLDSLPEADGSLTMRVRATEELSLPDALLALVRFDSSQLNPQEVVVNQELFPERRFLQFSLLDAESHVPVAVAPLGAGHMPALPPGSELFRIRFRRERQPALRQASIAPTGDRNQVEITMLESGARVQLQWAERHIGDYNLDGTVTITDITPLASHFNEAVGIDERRQVIDGTGDGVINIQDITPLAAQYFSSLTGYDVETAFVPEGSSDEPVFTRRPNEVFTDHPTVERAPPDPPVGWPLYYYSYPQEGFGTYYARVVPIGLGLSDRGVVSEAASLELFDLPPEPPSGFSIVEQTRNSVTLGWSASSLDWDVAGLDIYVSQDPEATDLSGYTKVNAELIPPTPAQYTVSPLTPNQTYYFVISATDQAEQVSPLAQVMATRLQVDIVDAPPAAPTGFTVTEAAESFIDFAWNPVLEDDVIGYNIYASEQEDAPLSSYTKLNAVAIPADTLEYTADTLEPVTLYWFVISAEDEASQESPEDDILATKIKAGTAFPPVAQISFKESEFYEHWPGTLLGDQSHSPSGISLTSFTWTFGDGSPPEEPPAPGNVQHTYTHESEAGYDVTLTVEDEFGAQASTEATTPRVQVPTEHRILLVWNSGSANDLEIKNYYGSPYTGRGIPYEFILGLPLSTNEEIDRNAYNTTIRDPIRTYLEDTTVDGTPLKDIIHYIVTTKDVPLKVDGSGGYEGEFASVDSELTLVFEEYALAPHTTNPYYGWLSSDYEDKGEPSKSQPWEPFHFSYGGVTMDYLVTRLTGWNVDDVEAMIDRSLDPYSGNQFYVVLDDANRDYDMMNYPNADGSESATDVLNRLLPAHLYSDTSHQVDKITADFLMDPTISDHVIGYCSHGVHSGFGSTYILDVLGFQYPNGALFMSYESFNGITLRNWPDSHPGHGQLADFIHMGGSGGIGNVYEPFSDACGDESILFAEYLNCGRNLAEACYKALRRTSWVEVVVGDPLCTVNVTP